MKDNDEPFTMMSQMQSSNSDLRPNFLQFHENAFVSPLNLINVTHPAPISFGRPPHALQHTILHADPSIPTPTPPLQTIDPKRLQMYQFLAQRKIKEDRWKQQMEENNNNNNNNTKPSYQRRNVRSTQSTSAGPPPTRRSASASASAPKRPSTKTFNVRPRESNRSHMTPSPISFNRPEDPSAAFSRKNHQELNDTHEQLLAHLRSLHNPTSRENIIDETEQEKQRRIRLKRERIKRDSRSIYNAHQELKQILHDLRQPEANLARLIHRHLNAYRSILLAVETLANEAPLKSQDTPVQQLLAAVLPILETLNQVNLAFGLSNCSIDRMYLETPSGKPMRRPVSKSESRNSPPNRLLPSIYQELMKKKQQQQQQQRKARPIPSVLRPRSAESVRLPRSITRPTIAHEQKTRARSHSPLPSIKRSPSTVATTFQSRFTVDHILGKLAPRLLANYTGKELNDQLERARTLIPMFLTDNRLPEEEIVQRMMQMLMPRGEPATDTSQSILRDETPEERKRRVNIDVYHNQISTWEQEMEQIRQRMQNYKTNRLEQETTAVLTTARRTVHFKLDSPAAATPLPENVQIHHPSFEYILEGFERKSIEHPPGVETSTGPFESRGTLHLRPLDKNKLRQIEQYRRDYRAYLQRTESTRTNDFDPIQAINRLSEFLLDEALLTVVNELEQLTVELSEKLVENELLGEEVTLADVEKQHRQHPPARSLPSSSSQQQQQQRTRPIQSMIRKHSPISPSPPQEQYNTSSFEDDVNTESRLSRSEDEPKLVRRTSPMEGTGRFHSTTAFDHRKVSDVSSANSSSSEDSPEGIIIKSPITMTKTASKSNGQYHRAQQPVPDLDMDVSSVSSSSKSKGRQQRHRSSDEDDLLLSTQLGEKIYSADFEDSKSNRRQMNDDEDEDEDDDDDDAADTMKLSARSLSKAHRQDSFNSDDYDDD